MPHTGRPKALLELTSEEREQLARWALRCRIILAGAVGAVARAGAGL